MDWIWTDQNHQTFKHQTSNTHTHTHALDSSNQKWWANFLPDFFFLSVIIKIYYLEFLFQILFFFLVYINSWMNCCRTSTCTNAGSNRLDSFNNIISVQSMINIDFKWRWWWWLFECACVCVGYLILTCQICCSFHFHFSFVFFFSSKKKI